MSCPMDKVRLFEINGVSWGIFLLSLWLFTLLLLRFWLTQLMLKPDACWEQCHQVKARAPFRQDRRPDWAKGPLCTFITCKLLSPAASIFYLVAFSKSTSLGKWYRPNLQAGGYKTSVYRSSFWSGSKSKWTTEAFMLPSVIRGIPTARWKRKDEHSHHQLGN